MFVLLPDCYVPNMTLNQGPPEWWCFLLMLAVLNAACNPRDTTLQALLEQKELLMSPIAELTALGLPLELGYALPLRRLQERGRASETACPLRTFASA